MQGGIGTSSVTGLGAGEGVRTADRQHDPAGESLSVCSGTALFNRHLLLGMLWGSSQFKSGLQQPGWA